MPRGEAAVDYNNLGPLRIIELTGRAEPVGEIETDPGDSESP